MTQNETTVEQVWGDCATLRSQLPPMLGWLDSPLLQQLYVQPNICGTADGNWLIWLVDKLGIPRDGHWLSIACGSGGLELFAAQQGLCATIEGVDIAPRAIELAQQQAAAQGIPQAQFRVQDLERTRLPHQHYDVILCGMGLHHIRRLEFFYEEARTALRPGGWLLLNEFVGASQWQWSDTQLVLANRLLNALPERYRMHAIHKTVKTSITRPTIEHMNAVDASESIRSAELLPLLNEHFTIIERRDYGGTILHLLLEYIIGNFQPDDPHAIELLTLLAATEQALLETGVLTSDFAVAAAQNTRPSKRQSALPFDAERERHIVYGAYALEQYGSTPFCWTAPDAAFVLRRPPAARMLALQIKLPPLARTLTLTLDDTVIAVLRAAPPPSLHQWHWQQVQLWLPASSNDQPTIRFQLDQPWVPAEVLHNGDTRPLGIALAQLCYQ